MGNSSESEDIDLEREKNKSWHLGHISQLKELGKEFRERAGEAWSEAEHRVEIEKARQLKSLGEELEERAGEKRERYDEKYKNKGGSE